MRVITGSAKGRKLFTPGKLNIRPTIDKVKGALFNVLGQKTIGCSFLDLFAGTGAVGIEALSRGAESAHFVENNRDAIRIIHRNIAHCAFAGQCRIKITQKDVQRTIERLYRDEQLFDIIFIDPPYHSYLSDTMLNIIAKFPIIKRSGIIVQEHFFKRLPPRKADNIILEKRTRYGDTSLSFYGIGKK